MLNLQFKSPFGGAGVSGVLKKPVMDNPAATAKVGGMGAGGGPDVMRQPSGGAAPIKKPGILGRMKSNMRDPKMRGSLLQSGLASLSSGLGYDQ